MFQLKTLSKEAIPAALEKAMRYRLLNEPGAAESICHDILKADPENHEALVTLLLAMSDRFETTYRVGDTQVNEVLARLTDPYERAYYAGILAERRGKAQLKRGGTGSRASAFEYLTAAMASYEKAEAIRPAGNESALLRWNTCARIMMQNKLEAREDEKVHVPGE